MSTSIHSVIKMNIRRRSPDLMCVMLDAVWAEDLEKIKRLLNTRDQLNRHKLIHWACAMTGKYKITELLVAGCKQHINERNERGETPLHVACYRCDVRTVKILLNHGCDVNALDDCNKGTALHIVARCRYVFDNMTGLYLENFRAIDDDAVRKMAEIFQVLLEHGADQSIKDEQGFTALQLSLLTGRDEFSETFRKCETKSRQEIDDEELILTYLEMFDLKDATPQK